jgi:hypothetical protein
LGTIPLQTAEQRDLDVRSWLKLSLVQVMLRSVMIGEMRADSPIGSRDRITPSRPLFAGMDVTSPRRSEADFVDGTENNRSERYPAKGFCDRAAPPIRMQLQSDNRVGVEDESQSRSCSQRHAGTMLCAIETTDKLLYGDGNRIEYFQRDETF